MMLKWEPVIAASVLQKETGINLSDCESSCGFGGQDYVRFDCSEKKLEAYKNRLMTGAYFFEQELVNEIQLIKAIRDEFGDMDYVIIDFEGEVL